MTTQSEYLLRIDPRTVKKTDQQLLAEGVGNPVYADGSVWLVNQGEIQGIDPTTLGVDNTIELKTGYPTSLAAGSRALWALGSSGYLSRVTPAGVSATLRLGKGASAVASGGGATWVAVSAG